MKSSTSNHRKSSTNGNARADERETSGNEIRARANQEMNPFGDLQSYARRYFREQPEISALTCLGIGFVLGWKLKPW